MTPRPLCETFIRFFKGWLPLASVHNIKSTKKSWQSQNPPPWQCMEFHVFYQGDPSHYSKDNICTFDSVIKIYCSVQQKKQIISVNLFCRFQQVRILFSDAQEVMMVGH